MRSFSFVTVSVIPLVLATRLDCATAFAPAHGTHRRLLSQQPVVTRTSHVSPPVAFTVTPLSLPSRLTVPPLSASTANGDNSSKDKAGKAIEKAAENVVKKLKEGTESPPKTLPGSNIGLKSQILTFLRIGVPSVLAGAAATLIFPVLSLQLASVMNDNGVLTVLSQDSSQFVQNFLSVASLLFSILVGQTYYFMYQQQEAVYYALFNEVTEAKSLLEQVALVCQGRTMYQNVLGSMQQYVQNDLKRLQDDPAVLLSARPMDDPLESIMYMTSVGIPSSVYETVRSLRQARAGRLGALQRKLPVVHFIMLWILALIQISSFPLLGAGTQIIGGYNILTVEGVLFGVMTFGVVLTMRVSVI